MTNKQASHLPDLSNCELAEALDCYTSRIDHWRLSGQREKEDEFIKEGWNLIQAAAARLIFGNTVKRG